MKFLCCAVLLFASGCYSRAAATVSSADKAKTSVVSPQEIDDLIHRLDKETFTPKLHDDFGQPDSNSGLAPIPDPRFSKPDAHDPIPEKRVRRVVTGYSPPWCAVCKRAKKESANDPDIEFRWIEDESQFPQWVIQTGSYPYFQWEVPGEPGGRFTTGWEPVDGLKKFKAIWRRTLEKKVARRAREMNVVEWLQERGKRIHGSRYVRDFCCRCDAPIRVESVADVNYCEECAPGSPPPYLYGLTERQRIGSAKTQ